MLSIKIVAPPLDEFSHRLLNTPTTSKQKYSDTHLLIINIIYLPVSIRKAGSLSVILLLYTAINVTVIYLFKHTYTVQQVTEVKEDYNIL